MSICIFAPVASACNSEAPLQKEAWLFQAITKDCVDVPHLLCRPFPLFITGMFCGCLVLAGMQRCPPCVATLFSAATPLHVDRPSQFGPSVHLVATNWPLQLLISSGGCCRDADPNGGGEWMFLCRWHACLSALWGSWSREGGVSAAIQLSREPLWGQWTSKLSGKSGICCFMCFSPQRRMCVRYSQSSDQGEAFLLGFYVRF